MNESAQSGILFGLSVLLAILIVKFPTWYRESKVKPGDVWVYCPENDDPFKSVKCDTTYVLQTHGNYALWREYRYSHLSRERYTYELSSRKKHVARWGAFRIKKGR